MKISELVKQLNEIAAKHGDLKVIIIEPDCGYSIEFDEFEFGVMADGWFEHPYENEKIDTVLLK